MNGVALCAWNGIALCAGYGGLELGLRLALGDRYRTVGVVERDLVAVSVLAARMADGSLEQAPIWDDVTTFDGTSWRGCVDIVTAGFPCQPFSVAGKRRGLDDERWIWPDIARIIGDVGPRYVFLENVPGLIRHGLGPVLGSLAEMGFAAEWGCFSAAEAGATHKRERIFILAYRDGERESQPEGADGDQRRRVGHCRSAVGDARGVAPREPGDPALWHEHGDKARDWAGATGRLFPPGPSDGAGWLDYLAGSSEAEPAVCFPSDGNTGRVDELFLLGNGVVPIVAAYAFLVLAQRFGAETKG